MLKNRILIALIWFFLLLLFFFQNSYKPIIILCFFSIILILDTLLFIFSVKKYQVSTYLKSDILDNKNISGSIHLNTENRFIFNKAIINLVLINQLTNERTKKKITSFGLKGIGEKRDFEMSSKYSGNLRLEIESIKFTDFLNLFEVIGKGEKREDELVIYPDSYYFEVTPPTFVGETNQIALAVNQNNAKQGDMFDFKAYEVGDPVKNIHWKLSMKEQELIVRELSEEMSHKQFIILETNFLTSKNKISNKSLHALLSSFVSTIESMVESNQIIAIGWLSQKSQSIQIETIDSKEDLQIIEKCLADISYQKSDSLVWDYFKSYLTQVDYSRIIYLYPDRTSGSFNEFPQSFPIAVGEKRTVSADITHINANQYEVDIANLII